MKCAHFDKILIRGTTGSILHWQNKVSQYCAVLIFLPHPYCVPLVEFQTPVYTMQWHLLATSTLK